ncbi:MAG: hypothetical protein J0H99_17440, partial [Rhodospirillales bacterium]|nr:hypothetical protein [Rhodospirillales bacterium]
MTSRGRTAAARRLAGDRASEDQMQKKFPRHHLSSFPSLLSVYSIIARRDLRDVSILDLPMVATLAMRRRSGSMAMEAPDDLRSRAIRYRRIK